MSHSVINYPCLWMWLISLQTLKCSILDPFLFVFTNSMYLRMIYFACIKYNMLHTTHLTYHHMPHTLIKRKQCLSSLLLIRRSTDRPMYSASFWNRVFVSSSVSGLMIISIKLFSFMCQFNKVGNQLPLQNKVTQSQTL